MLIDRSPGLFIVLANVIVFGVIGVEIWMWTAASVLAVAFTLLLIATFAGVICTMTFRLLDDATFDPQRTEAPARTAAPRVAAPAVAAATAPTRAPRPRTAAHA